MNLSLSNLVKKRARFGNITIRKTQKSEPYNGKRYSRGQHDCQIYLKPNEVNVRPTRKSKSRSTSVDDIIQAEKPLSISKERLNSPADHEY